MQLANPRLGDIEHGRDFLEVHVLLVVHAHDELLAFGQVLDGRNQGLTQALVAQHIERVGLAVAHMAVEEAVVIVAASGHVFQINQLRAANFAEQGLVVGQAHVEFGRNFALKRTAPELVFEPAQGLLDFFLALARAARHPVVAAQFVEHGATNALRGKGLKLNALRHLIPGQGFGQSDQADLNQVINLHVGRQFRHHVVGQAAHQRLVLPDHRVAVKLPGGGVHQ